MPNITSGYENPTISLPVPVNTGALPDSCETIYFHGGCDGNNQPDREQRHMNMAVYINGAIQTHSLVGGSNNEAALHALIQASQLALAAHKTDTLFLGHNETVINLINGATKTKLRSLKVLVERFHQLAHDFRQWDARYIPSGDNLAMVLENRRH